jgi:DNA invertase Pin-like site-specific DNA recombinase
MNIVLLKNRNDEPSVTSQQKQILKYAHHHALKIDTTEIENSDLTLELEERKEFKGFLRSLEKEDHIIIHDLTTFSESIEELVKVFECLLKRSICVHIAEPNALVSVTSSPLVLLELLVKQREINKQLETERSQGRPKGRMSKSKFDTYRPRVIELLEAKTSVSEIAKILHVSRTSLKDYINSRGLKDLVKAKITLLKTPKKQLLASKIAVAKECSLIKESTQLSEGTSHAM